MATFCLVVAVMAILQFVISVAVEGVVDVVKHLYLFQLLFDICLTASVAWLLGGLRTLLSGRAQRTVDIAELARQQPSATRGGGQGSHPAGY